MTRKAFLGALLSQVTLAGLGGCGAAGGLPGGAPSVSGSDDALALALDSLGRLYGGSYEALGEIAEKELSFGGAEYWFLLRPEGDPGRPFRAYVGASDESRLIKGPNNNLSQYLFKGRAEGPFLEALRACPGLAGCSATLRYTRFDGRAWGPGEFGEYMGSGRDGEPCVDVNVMVPRDGDAASWAEAAEAAFAAMYGVGMAMRARVGVEGTDPYRSALRLPDIDEMFPATRRDPPTAARLAEDFELALTFDEPYSTSWDGNGNPDGVPRDPSDSHSRATIEWFDGHGPDRW